MSTHDTPINRQPAGVPTGGQFAPGTHPESSVTLADNSPRINLDLGEGMEYPHLADGEIIRSLVIDRSYGFGECTVVAEHRLNLAQTVTAEDLGTNEAGHKAWLSKHNPTIQSFLAKRYEAEPADYPDADGNLGMKFHVRHLDRDDLTEAKALDLALTDTKITQLADEADPESDSQQDLSQMLRSHVANTTVVDDFSSNLDKARELDKTVYTIDRHVDARSQRDRTISDVTALAIARRMTPDGGRGRYPALFDLATRGHVNTKELTDDLKQGELDSPNPVISRRFRAMQDWVEKGGDNA